MPKESYFDDRHDILRIDLRKFSLPSRNQHPFLYADVAADPSIPFATIQLARRSTRDELVILRLDLDKKIYLDQVSNKEIASSAPEIAVYIVEHQRGFVTEPRIFSNRSEQELVTIPLDSLHIKSLGTIPFEKIIIPVDRSAPFARLYVRSGFFGFSEPRVLRIDLDKRIALEFVDDKDLKSSMESLFKYLTHLTEK